MTTFQISHVLEIPVRLLRQILYELVESGILSQTRTNDDKTFSYQPARDISTLTIKYILEALEQRGTNSLPVAQTEELKALSKALKAFNEALRINPKNAEEA